MSVCVCVCFLFIPPFTHALPPPRPAVNLDMKACCCDRTNKNQTNPLDYSPLSELFPVSSPDRKSGMRDSSLPVVVWGNAKDVDTHALQHTDTQIYQTESRVQFSCLTADRVGVCVCLFHDEHQGHEMETYTDKSPQQHNKYGFSRYFCHI